MVTGYLNRSPIPQQSHGIGNVSLGDELPPAASTPPHLIQEDEDVPACSISVFHQPAARLLLLIRNLISDVSILGYESRKKTTGGTDVFQ